MNKFQSTIALLLVGGLLASSCTKKEEDPKPNEEGELITSVTLHLTSPTGSMVMATWKDLTPDDAACRTIDTLFLSDSTFYTGIITLLDETKTPNIDITEEVEEESKDHLFVYKPDAALAATNLSISRTDKDANNLEIGLKYSLETKITGSGGLRVILRHQPGEKNGSEAPGDSDVDVVFPVKIR